MLNLDPKQDFVGADLSGVDLSGKDLSYVNFTRVNLQGANLSNANLQGADFTGADLSSPLKLAVRKPDVRHRYRVFDICKSITEPVLSRRDI